MDPCLFKLRSDWKGRFYAHGNYNVIISVYFPQPLKGDDRDVQNPPPHLRLVVIGKTGYVLAAKVIQRLFPVCPGSKQDDPSHRLLISHFLCIGPPAPLPAAGCHIQQPE